LSPYDHRKIVASFPSIQALIIGDVMLDSYIWGVVERISPEATGGHPVNVKKKDFRWAEPPMSR